MPDFSQEPDDALEHARSQGYTRAHIQQGVPVLDRDLNLLGDLPSEMLRLLTQTVIGDGAVLTPPSTTSPTPPSPFAIVPTDPPSNDFIIDGPGTFYAGGLRVDMPARIRFSEHGPGGIVPPPPATDTRKDAVFLEVIERVFEDTMLDRPLGNPDDIGERTSKRIKVEWRVHYVTGPATPPASDGFVILLATVLRDASEPGIGAAPGRITDRRPSFTPLNDIYSRLDALERRPALLPVSDPSRPSEFVFRLSTLSGGNVEATLAIPDGRRTLVVAGFLAGGSDVVPDRQGAPMFGLASANQVCGYHADGSAKVRLASGVLGRVSDLGFDTMYAELRASWADAAVVLTLVFNTLDLAVGGADAEFRAWFL